MTLTDLMRALGTVLVLGVPAAAHAAAQDVASLYGPQPPANATYVRVVNLATQSARVTLPGSEAAQTLAAGASTRLSVVTPGTPLRVTVDGREPVQATAADAAGAVSASDATAGQAITVMLTRESQGWRATRVANPQERLDAMRATLRVYNVAGGACAGKSLMSLPSLTTSCLSGFLGVSSKCRPMQKRRAPLASVTGRRARSMSKGSPSLR